MNLLFFTILFFGLAYFLFVKRAFDHFSMLYFSSIFYFSPGFAGFVPIYFGAQTVAIISQTYLVMSIVLLAILSSAVLFDLQSAKKVIKAQLSSSERAKCILLVKILVIFSAVCAIGNFSIVDRSLLAGGVEKIELLDSSTYFYNYWVYPAILGCFLAYYFRMKWYLVLAFILLLLDVYFYAMRVHFVMAMLAIVFYWLYSKGPIRLILKLNYAVLMLPVGLFFFIFKSLIRPLNEGNYGLFFERLLDSDVYMYWLIRAEPFNQVAILNKVLINNFVTPASHILMSPLTFIPYSGKIDFGLMPRFHDYFYPVLYPNMQVGAIASNPWAQLMSSGGFLMLSVGLLAFLTLIYLLNKKLMYGRASMLGIILITLVPILCFYMHRNDLYFTLLMCKRLFFPVLAILLARIFVIQFLQKRLQF